MTRLLICRKVIKNNYYYYRRLSGDVTSLHQPENDPCFGVKKPITLAGGTQFIDPLLFLVIPRSPKTCSQNIATFKPFPS